MTFTYQAPTNLQGTVSGYTADLTWLQALPIAGGTTPPPGYDIYRDGVSIATFLNGDLYYDDTVPTGGIYTYNVAAYGPTQTLLMLHFDGNTNDSSGNNPPMTLLSGAALAAGGSPVGDTDVLSVTGSHASNTAVGYIPINSGGPLDLSTVSSWTIEMWINISGTGTFVQYFVALGVGVTGPAFNGILLSSDNTGYLQLNVDNYASPIITFNTHVDGTWEHVVIEQRPNATVPGQVNFQMFLNGVGSGWTPDTQTYYPIPSVGAFVLGGYYDEGAYYPGNTGAVTTLFSEIRISNTLIYTANFTPPTAPLSVVGGDISPLSEPLVLDINAPAIPLYGKFVGPSVYKPVLIGDSAGIEPRIWKPRENNTVQP